MAPLPTYVVGPLPRAGAAVGPPWNTNSKHA